MDASSLGGTPATGGATLRWHNSKDTQLAAQRFQQALNHHKRELTNLLNLRAEYSVLDEQLQTLPHAISHQVMVPVGSQAIFPGRLVKTNEITVLLGDNYFAKCSAHHARSIVSRRLDVIERKIAAAEKQVRELELRVAHALEMSSNDRVCEIIEPYQMDDDAERSKDASGAVAAASASDVDVEEERSNIEETEARLRFLFGNEDEWMDDEEGSSGGSQEEQAAADEHYGSRRGGARAGDDDNGDDDDDDDDDDEGDDDGDDDDAEVDSGVDVHYLADFTSSVQSRRAQSSDALASPKPSPIVTNPAQLYDLMYSSAPSQAAAAPVGRSSQASASHQREAFQSSAAPARQASASASGGAAVANAAFTGRIVEQIDPVRIPPRFPEPA